MSKVRKLKLSDGPVGRIHLLCRIQFDLLPGKIPHAARATKPVYHNCGTCKPQLLSHAP